MMLAPDDDNCDDVVVVVVGIVDGIDCIEQTIKKTRTMMTAVDSTVVVEHFVCNKKSAVVVVVVDS